MTLYAAMSSIGPPSAAIVCASLARPCINALKVPPYSTGGRACGMLSHGRLDVYVGEPLSASATLTFVVSSTVLHAHANKRCR